jgi:hypothetical protein
MKDALNEVVVRGGILASVSDATRELHEARLLAERSLYLFKRMPMLAQWHGQLFGYEVLTLPETRGLLTDIDQATTAATKLQATVERYPEEITALRRDLLEDAAQRLSLERKALLGEMDALLERQRTATLDQLQSQYADLQRLADSAGNSAQAMREASQALLTVVGPYTPKKAGEATGLDKINEGLERLVVASHDLKVLTERVERLAQSDTAAALADLDALLARHEQRLFLYAAGLLVLAFVLGAGLVILFRRPRAS